MEISSALILVRIQWELVSPRESNFFEKSGCKIFKALSPDNVFVLLEKHGLGF